MTLEEYKTQAAALGIDRGELAAGFSDQINHSLSHEVNLFDDRHTRYRPAPEEFPDLSAINPPRHDVGKVSGRNGGHKANSNRLKKV